MSVAVAIKLYSALSKGMTPAAIFLRNIKEEGFEALVKGLNAKDLKRLSDYSTDGKGAIDAAGAIKARKMAHHRALRAEKSGAPLFNQPYEVDPSKGMIEDLASKLRKSTGMEPPAAVPVKALSQQDIIADIMGKDAASNKRMVDEVRARQSPLPNATPTMPTGPAPVNPNPGIIYDHQDVMTRRGQGRGQRRRAFGRQQLSDQRTAHTAQFQDDISGTRAARQQTVADHPRTKNPSMERKGPSFGKRFGDWAGKASPKNIMKTFKDASPQNKAIMAVGGLDLGMMALPGGLNMLAKSKIGLAGDRLLGGDEHQMEMQKLLQEVRIGGLKDQYKHAKQQQNIETNAMALAREAPDVYQMVMAGRMLPNGSTSIGGRRRVDLLEQVAMGMGQGRGVTKSPNPDDFLNQLMGGGVL